MLNLLNSLKHARTHCKLSREPTVIFLSGFLLQAGLQEFVFERNAKTVTVEAVHVGILNRLNAYIVLLFDIPALH